MSQVELVIALLVLVAAGVGAIGCIVAYFARNAAEDRQDRSSGPSSGDAVELAHRRREFLRRYPSWAARDFQNDRSSPWFTDPEFSQGVRR